MREAPAEGTGERVASGGRGERGPSAAGVESEWALGRGRRRRRRRAVSSWTRFAPVRAEGLCGSTGVGGRRGRRRGNSSRVETGSLGRAQRIAWNSPNGRRGGIGQGFRGEHEPGLQGAADCPQMLPGAQLRSKATHCETGETRRASVGCLARGARSWLTHLLPGSRSGMSGHGVVVRADAHTAQRKRRNRGPVCSDKHFQERSKPYWRERKGYWAERRCWTGLQHHRRRWAVMAKHGCRAQQTTPPCRKRHSSRTNKRTSTRIIRQFGMRTRHR